MARILQIEDNETGISRIFFLTCFLMNMKLSKLTLGPKESFCFKAKRLIWFS